MKAKPPRIVIRRGREITVYTEVKLWRRRMKAFKAAKKRILERFLAVGWDKPQIKEFLALPHPDLGGRTPHSMLNPKSITVLAKFISTVLK